MMKNRDFLNAKVSVIIPVYNAKEHIAKCINSVIYQTYKNIEIILVDDGSTDKSLEICKSYARDDKRVIVLHQKNGGVSKARNHGIKYATGKYVTFVDADDWIDKNAIKEMVRIASKEEVDCVRMMYHVESSISKSKKIELAVPEGKYADGSVGKLIPWFITGKEPSYVWLWLIKRANIPSIKPFYEDIRMMEDTCFVINLLLNADSVYISNNVTYRYADNPDSASKSPKLFQRNMQDIIKVNLKMNRDLTCSNLSTNSLKVVMDLTHSNIVANYLFLMYKADRNNLDMVYDSLHLLHNNKHYRAMLTNLDISRLPLHLRYTIKSIINNKPAMLISFFRLRLVASNLKSIILGLS
jgi:glycosyltransferase involved in cell wall biosynthesis